MARNLLEQPILLYLMIGFLVFMVFRLAYLRQIQRRGVRSQLEIRDGLELIHEALQNYARQHEGRFPESITEAVRALPPASQPIHGWVYRPVPTATIDPKLLLVYEACGNHASISFPRLRRVSHALFSSGKIELFDQEELERVIHGDNLLREKLGLESIPMEQTKKEVDC